MVITPHQTILHRYLLHLLSEAQVHARQQMVIIITATLGDHLSIANFRCHARRSVLYHNCLLYPLTSPRLHHHRCRLEGVPRPQPQLQPPSIGSHLVSAHWICITMDLAPRFRCHPTIRSYRMPFGMKMILGNLPIAVSSLAAYRYLIRRFSVSEL